MSVNLGQQQKSFLERAAWLTGANLLAFALSFLTPLVIVRIFNQAEFGTYKQLFQILATFMTVFYMQIPSSAYYFMPREPNKRLQVAMNIILCYLVVGSIVVAAFAVFPNWPTYVFHNPALDEYIPLLGLALTLWLIATNVEVFPLVLGDVRTASVFIVLSQISKSLVLIGAAVIFGSLKALLWGSIIQGAIQCAFMLCYIHFRIGSLAIRPDRLFDWPLLKKQLSNSMPYAGGSMTLSIQADLHNYFVSYYFTAAAFAVYANGCFQMPLLSLLQTSFRDALTPEVARLEAAGNYRAIVHSWLNAMRKLSFVVLPACALMFILRYELITTLFTKAYAGSVPIFTVYLVFMLTQMVLTASIMRTIPDFRYFRLKLNLIQTPLTFVALYIGIKLAGMVGAVTATVCIHLLDVTVCVTAICIRLRVKREDLKQLAPVARTVPAVIVAMIAAYTVKTLVNFAHSIVIIGACATVFALMYLIATVVFGALTTEDKSELYKRAQRLSQRFISRMTRMNRQFISRTTQEAKTEAVSQTQTLNRAKMPRPVKRRPLIRKSREFKPELKARAVLQVLQDTKSAAQICHELRINENLLSRWKEQFLEQASTIFEKEPASETRGERIAELERLVGRMRLELESERTAELERLVGRLTLELEAAKKVSAFPISASSRNGRSS